MFNRIFSYLCLNDFGLQVIKEHNIPILPNASLLHEKDFGIAVGRIYSNGIFHMYFFKGTHINMEFIHSVFEFNEMNGGRAYRNLFEFEARVDLDPEVRDWAAAPNGNTKTIADALVINNLAHKILANFYVKFNKPVKPTKIFESREKAIKWLLAIEA